MTRGIGRRATWLLLLAAFAPNGAHARWKQATASRSSAADERAATAVAYVVRHFDAGADGPDPGLTVAGERRAQELNERLRRAGVRAIYVTATRRARESAAPMAARLGIEPTVYDPARPDLLVAAVRARGAPSLIVGHSNTVPDIVGRLGGSPPPALSHDQFGDVWEVDGDGTTRRSHVD